MLDVLNRHMLASATTSTVDAVLPLRIRYRQEMNGQIVHDSIHRRDGSGQNDDSPALIEDTNPQSGGSVGVVYDLDAPGIGYLSGNINRVRFNFNEYAVLDSASSTQQLGSFAWYARASCIENPNPANGYFSMFSTSVANDNTAGSGTTGLTWNLQ